MTLPENPFYHGSSLTRVQPLLGCAYNWLHHMHDSIGLTIVVVKGKIRGCGLRREIERFQGIVLRVHNHAWDLVVNVIRRSSSFQCFEVT